MAIPPSPTPMTRKEKIFEVIYFIVVILIGIIIIIVRK